MVENKLVLHLARIFLIIWLPIGLSAQSTFDAAEFFAYTKQYVVYKTSVAPIIDGEIKEKSWNGALWTDTFVDIEGDEQPKPAFATRAKMMWDDSYLYIAAELQEPHIWATLKNHDQIIYHDNDFEVFIDPESNGLDYYEIEVNAYNTILDLFLPKPYRVGGQALLHWDVHNLQTAVKIEGTINNPHDKDEGWTLEMAIPFRSVSLGNHTKVPQEGTLWRINFSRVQWDVEIADGKYQKKKDADGSFLPEHNWVWSPQGVVNMHFPERWGYVYFSELAVGSSNKPFIIPPEESQKQLLWLIYHKQKEYHQQNGQYANAMKTLGINTLPPGYAGSPDLLKSVSIEAGNYQFIVILAGKNQKSWSINHEGLLRQIKN